MGFGKWQISITSLLISGLYLGNVHIQIYHKASPDQEKESHDTDRWSDFEWNYAHTYLSTWFYGNFGNCAFKKCQIDVGIFWHTFFRGAN